MTSPDIPDPVGALHQPDTVGALYVGAVRQPGALVQLRGQLTHLDVAQCRRLIRMLTAIVGG